MHLNKEGNSSLEGRVWANENKVFMFRDKWSHDPKCMRDFNPHLDLSQDFQFIGFTVVTYLHGWPSHLFTIEISLLKYTLLACRFIWYACKAAQILSIGNSQNILANTLGGTYGYIVVGSRSLWNTKFCKCTLFFLKGGVLCVSQFSKRFVPLSKPVLVNSPQRPP